MANAAPMSESEASTLTRFTGHRRMPITSAPRFGHRSLSHLDSDPAQALDGIRQLVTAVAVPQPDQA
jgi:hypothetical protein